MRWLLLQLADSAFPAGGFAHSGGLEAAAQLGEADDLRAFVEAALWQAGCGALPLVRAGHGAGEPELAALDARCDGFLANHVANRASRTQGRAFAATCARSFPDAGAIDDAVRAGRLRGHLAPIFGALCGQLGVDRADALALYLHLTLRGLLSAAVRLGRCGPHEGQGLQRALAPLCDRVLAACAERPVDALAQTAPIADLLAALHDRLYSRLFQS